MDSILVGPCKTLTQKAWIGGFTSTSTIMCLSKLHLFTVGLLFLCRDWTCDYIVFFLR